MPHLVSHMGINSSGTSGYETCVRALHSQALSAPGTSHAKRRASSDEERAYAHGVMVMPAVAQPLRIRGRVTARRGGRDRISNTRIDLRVMDAQEVTREEPDYPHARADARRFRPGPARIRVARGADCSRGGRCGDQLRTGRQQDLRYGRVEVADGGELVIVPCHSVLSTAGARQI